MHVISTESATVDPMNVGDVPRSVVIQAGAFREHSFTSISVADPDSSATLAEAAVGSDWGPIIKPRKLEN